MSNGIWNGILNALIILVKANYVPCVVINKVTIIVNDSYNIFCDQAAHNGIKVLKRTSSPLNKLYT